MTAEPSTRDHPRARAGQLQDTAPRFLWGAGRLLTGLAIGLLLLLGTSGPLVRGDSWSSPPGPIGTGTCADAPETHSIAEPWIYLPTLTRYEVIASYPHDTEAYTQGLVWHEGVLYESTGLHGRSSLRAVDLTSGTIHRQIAVPSIHFAEGMTIVGDDVFQLTWRSQVGFVYDLATFRLERTFTYDGEGWGLTHNGQSLIMSDGTHRIRFLDPETLTVIRWLDVYDAGRPIANLNELEYICGEIWANVWQTSRIARIDPASGEVVGWVDLAGLPLIGDRTPTTSEMNGIAYDAATGRILITGKLWAKVYEIRVARFGHAPNQPRIAPACSADECDAGQDSR